MPINNSDALPSASLSVALVQMVSSDDWRDNLNSARSLINEACEAYQPDLVQLPENALSFGGKAQRHLAQNAESCLTELAGIARNFGVYLHVGSFPMALRKDGSKISDRLRSSSLVFAPDGNLHARYDKLHLFDVDVEDAHGAYRESDTFEAGSELETFVVKGWRCGLSICYDLRFAELYSCLRAAACHVLCVPSAFTAVTGAAHWEHLLKARAIENQCYVLAADQGGKHSGGRETWGHSMVLDPWGRMLSCLPQGAGIVHTELDPELLRKVRKDMPVSAHRRCFSRLLIDSSS